MKFLIGWLFYVVFKWLRVLLAAFPHKIDHALIAGNHRHLEHRRKLLPNFRRAHVGAGEKAQVGLPGQVPGGVPGKRQNLLRGQRGNVKQISALSFAGFILPRRRCTCKSAAAELCTAFSAVFYKIRTFEPRGGGTGP